MKPQSFKAIGVVLFFVLALASVRAEENNLNLEGGKVYFSYNELEVNTIHKSNSNRFLQNATDATTSNTTANNVTNGGDLLIVNNTDNNANKTNNATKKVEEDHTFMGGFSTSLAMICFAEFGDRVRQSYYLIDIHDHNAIHHEA